MKYLSEQNTEIVALVAGGAVFYVIVRIENLKPLPVIFQAPNTEAVIALLPLLIMLVFAVLIFRREKSLHNPAEQQNPSTYTFSKTSLQLLSSGLVLLPFAITMIIRKQGLATIYLSPYNLSASIVGGCIAGVVACAFFGRLSLRFWLTPSTFFMLIAQLGVSFCEEVIFRGYLLSRFSAWLGILEAGLITAGIFALAHIPQRLSMGLSVRSLVIELGTLFLWGLIFNWIVWQTSNIAGLAIFHAILNTTELSPRNHALMKSPPSIEAS